LTAGILWTGTTVNKKMNILLNLPEMRFRIH